MKTIAMRTVGAVVAVLALAGFGLAGVSTATATVNDNDNKITYCHATHSETNPYVVVTTAKVAVLQAHQNHQDDEDIIPAFEYVMKGEAGVFSGQTFGGVDPSSFVAGGCLAEAPPQ